MFHKNMVFILKHLIPIQLTEEILASVAQQQSLILIVEKLLLKAVVISQVAGNKVLVMRLLLYHNAHQEKICAVVLDLLVHLISPIKMLLQKMSHFH